MIFLNSSSFLHWLKALSILDVMEFHTATLTFSSGIPNVGPSAVFAKLRSIKKEVEEEMRNENENENKSKINFETLVMSRL